MFALTKDKPERRDELGLSTATKGESLELAQDVGCLARTEREARGAVFTKPEVVTFMLELVGYTTNRDLTALRILEPSFGEGNFLLPMIDRLLVSWRAHHSDSEPYRILHDCVRGVELHHETAAATRQKVIARLQAGGIDQTTAHALAGTWLLQNDFLTAPIGGSFTHVVGNPPYVRHERISRDLLKVYRDRYATFYDRADLYIPFFERGLTLLGGGGQLSFICSDRWLKNRYGKRLRGFIAEGYGLKHYVDMVGTNAFRTKVAAYTSVVTLVKGRATETRVAKRPRFGGTHLNGLAAQLNASACAESSQVEVFSAVVNGDAPWLFGAAPQLQLLRALEAAFIPLEAAGAKVGIGVASGCDRVFIAPFGELDVEPERKLPLAMAQDLTTGHFRWGGQGIVNPFEADGTLTDPERYPKFEAFLEANRAAVMGRYVARKNPVGWFRTVDRIDLELVGAPKLLIPDIRNEPTVVYDKGTAYPHHNLYWVTSRTWDFRALQAVLRSDVARLFVWAHSVKLRGGWLRFQAQNLRRICVPAWNEVNEPTRATLKELGNSSDRAALNTAVFELYGLDAKDIDLMSSLSTSVHLPG